MRLPFYFAIFVLAALAVLGLCAHQSVVLLEDLSRAVASHSAASGLLIRNDIDRLYVPLAGMAVAAALSIGIAIDKERRWMKTARQIGSSVRWLHEQFGTPFRVGSECSITTELPF